MISKSMYELRKLDKNELDFVTEVFTGTRNQTYETTYFSQKFSGASEIDCISFAHFDGKKPISHCVAIPYTFTAGQSKQLIGAQVCDAVTLPEYQRKGLFSQLNDEILKRATEEKVDFLFRFPSPHNYQKVIGKFGFTHIDDFHSFDFNFRYVPPILKLFQKFKWTKLTRLYLKGLSGITFSRKMIVSNSMEADETFVIPHNKSYFDYKKYLPSYRMSVFGDKYWVAHEDGLLVGDINLKSDRRFLRKLKVFCFIFGIHKVRFMVSSQSNEFKVLSKLTESTGKTPICIRLINNKLDISAIKFTFADSDTF